MDLSKAYCVEVVIIHGMPQKAKGGNRTDDRSKYGTDFTSVKVKQAQVVNLASR